MRVLLGVTGSVAAVRTPRLVQLLLDEGHEVRVMATEASLAFFRPHELPTAVSLFRDRDEWPPEGQFNLGDPVLHIELRRWADLLLLAPLDANTLGKIGAGICDNLVTSVFRAWEVQRPVVLAPAMNTMMWRRPATARGLRAVADEFGLAVPVSSDPDVVVCALGGSRSLRVVGPIFKRLACGDEGLGAMAEPEAIVAAVSRKCPSL